jgi:AraC-like DNA-binding protein
MITIIIIGFFQAAFFAVLALAKRKKEVADYILATLFLLLCYHLGVNFINVTGYREVYPHFIGTGQPISLLYGPILFFFIRNYISKYHTFKPGYLLHLAPFILDNIHNFLVFYPKSGEEKVQYLLNIIDGKPDIELSVSLLIHSISPLIYCIWSISVLRLHRKNIKKYFSFTSEHLKVEWLWILTWSMLIVGFICLILNSIIIFSNIADWVQLRLMIVTVGAIWVFFLGYYSVRKTPFYRSYHIEGLSTLDEHESEQTGGKYEKTKLKDEDVQSIKQRLDQHLIFARPYLNRNLTISDLAEALEVPAYQLSQVINGHMDQTFYELINTYRVNEVKQRFFDTKYRNLTLLGIAMECGFNSKASFNRIFKQLTNQTPTEYIKTKKVA